MIPRILFFLVVLFWVTMNVLLWRAQYGAHGGEFPVPVDLVWRKILTAPDASTLTIFQSGHQIGFCEFVTSVEQEMAKLDEDKLPPEGVAKRAGYQVRLTGNISVGDFTNRMKFDGHFQFSSLHDWREINLRLSMHGVVMEIQSAATNQSVHLKIKNGNSTIERDLTLADLQNPNALLRSFAGNSPVGFLDELELPLIPQNSFDLAQHISWQAYSERLTIDREPATAYRLETTLFGNPIAIHVSTLGEILRVELPGGVTAAFDELNEP